jgi:molecular chaperone GrpE
MEVQPGYMIGDHLLRAAMVVVSKGPPAEQS